MLSHNRLSGGSNPSRPIQQKVHTVSRYGPFCFMLVGEGESLRRVESAEFRVLIWYARGAGIFFYSAM